MTHNRITAIVFVGTALLLSSCTSAEEQARQEARAEARERLESMREFADSLATIDSTQSAITAEVEAAYPDVTYRKLYVADAGVLDSLRTTFDYRESKGHKYKTFVTLNRRVFSSVRVGDSVVVPSTIAEDMRAYSVFPHVWFGAEDIPKVIVVSNDQQSYACYENGRLVRFAACNTGTENKPTLPGRYAINWKERLRTSSINENWKLPFNLNFHLFAGNAFHQYYMPGRPASHSCVRQFRDDAEWLYEWAQIGTRNSSGRVERFTGTPVIIIDMFDFARPKYGPWLDVADNRSYRLELPDDPMAVEEAWIPISQIPPSARGGLPDRNRYAVAEDTLRARGVLRPEARLSWSIEYPREKDRKPAASTSSRAGSSSGASSTSSESSTPAPATTPAPTTTPPATPAPEVE